MIILDTNVLSAVMQKRPPREVIDWLDEQVATSVYTTAISVFEVRYGISRRASGRKRRRLEASFDALLHEDLDDRILAFDRDGAEAAGELAAKLEKRGKTLDVRDLQIAGIATAHRAVVATRNTAHLNRACDVVDPWNEAS